MAADVAEAAKAAEKAATALCEKMTCLVQKVLPGAEVRLVKSVAGRMVYVIDGALNREEVEHMFRVVESSSYRRTGFARPDTIDVKHAVAHYSVQEFKDTSVFVKCMQFVEVLFPERLPQFLHRVYCNAKLYGDVGLVHRDCDGDNHVTAIVYPNLSWKPELYGETFFYTPDSSPDFVVAPVPGRICIFDSYILHSGSAPSRFLHGYRYTLALKFAPYEAADGGGDEQGDDRQRLTSETPPLL